MNIKSNLKLNPHLINPHAHKIIKTLQESGFTTYLVGGSVRDLLLGLQPKDFDISTTAHPYQIKKIIPQAYIIGKRFRLVLVKRGQEQFEVSTFRRDALKKELKINFKKLFVKKTKAFRHRKNNFFGTPEEDAKRRDFTINALFYDPIKYELIDYVGGLKDLKKRLIQMIGEPHTRLKEDPVRILRALRLSYTIQFNIDEKLKAAMKDLASRLRLSALPRRRQEILKILSTKDPSLPLLEAYKLNVLKYISKNLNEIFSSPQALKVCLNYLKIYHKTTINKNKALELFYPLLLASLRSLESLDQLKPSIFNPIAKIPKIFSPSFSPFPFLNPSDPKEDLQIAKKQKNKTQGKKREPLPFEFLSQKKNPYSQKIKDSLTTLMKKELGLFKYEQELFLKSLKVINLLKSNLELKTKKSTIKSLYSEEVFILSLKIAKQDHIFSAKGLSFWKKNIKNFKERPYRTRKTNLEKKKLKIRNNKPETISNENK